jgi:hypothetical protein
MVSAIDDRIIRRLVDKIALLPWARATFFRSLAHEQSPVLLRAESNAVRAWLNDIAGQTKSLIEEIETADVVVMIVGAGITAEQKGSKKKKARLIAGPLIR